MRATGKNVAAEITLRKKAEQRIHRLRSRLHEKENEMQVTWKMPGLYKADANIVAQEITSIEDATPQNILEVAKNPNSELHKCFTWDDSEAAQKWRLHEARNIVCNLVISPKEDDKEKISVRVLYKTDSGGYKPTQLIVRQQDEYRKLLECALAELRAFKRKYQNITELDEIMTLID